MRGRWNSYLPLSLASHLSFHFSKKGVDIFKAIPVGPGRTKDGNCTMAQVYPIKKGSQELWIKNKKREVFSRTKQALLPPTPARLATCPFGGI